MAEHIKQRIERGKKSICDFCFHQKVCKGTGNQPCTKCSHYQDAANVAPVRHGRWLDVQETDMYVPDLKLTATKTAETCSVCKARIGFIGAKLYLFDSICPSCGAKMDLEEAE